MQIVKRFMLVPRAQVRGTRLRFSASPDARAWQGAGPGLNFSRLSDDYGSTLRFSGAMVDVCAQDLSGRRAAASFDYVAYQPCGT